MILTDPTYFYERQFNYPFDLTLSFIQTTNEVETIEKAEIIVIDSYLYHRRIELINNLLKLNKRIIIDSTFELLWEPILNELLKLDSLHNVEYYCISRDDNYAAETIKKCQAAGLIIRQSQYFADFQDYYKPIISDKNIEKKKYILHTGKTRPERTLLVALLSQCDLIEYGYVSYFGNDFNEYAKNEKIENVFNLPEVLKNESLKLKIQEGLDKLNLPLKIDVDTLSFITAHSKTFNADYYMASDFAVVCETIYDHNSFITEKTTKCILMNKKFLVFSNVNYVQHLKEYYLKTFNKDISHLTDWCDLSYDKEPNKVKRAELIVEEIKKEVLR